MTKTQEREAAQAAMDAETVQKIKEVAERMTLEQLWRFCEGTLRASAVSQQVMIQRFGLEEWQRFNLAVESGRIKIP